MHRRKLLPIWVAAALFSGPAAALGVGEIRLMSYLGRPLQAEIALNDLGDLSADQLKIRLGSEADYQTLGVEYAYLHSQLKIEPLVRNGRGFVRISTHEAIAEPYLNFVLNVQWPQGRVVREFTVLLDPAPIAAVAAAAPVDTGAAVAAAQPAPTAEPAARRERRRSDANATDGAYTVQRGDSLWRIASRLQPQNASLQQTMSAIVALNPHAFINGNPDRIKEAARIVTPSAQQIADAAAAATPAAAATAARPAAVASAAVAPLAEENAALKAQVAELTSSVDSLSGNLVQSEQHLHQLEGQLDSLLQQFQQQRAALAALQQGGAAPAAGAPATAGSMINQVNAAELRPTPIAHTPWWVHLLYWLGIGGAAMWAIREHFWPQRRLALLGAEQASAASAGSAPRAAPAGSYQPLPALEELELDELAPAAAPAGAAPPALKAAADDPVDVSISAGVFLAFGRYDEAERLLREGLQNAPQRVDLKLQLLDVYMQADQRGQFEALAREIEAGPITPEIVAELAVLRESYHPRGH